MMTGLVRMASGEVGAIDVGLAVMLPALGVDGEAGR
jgi:hypothetical protein